MGILVPSCWLITFRGHYFLHEYPLLHMGGMARGRLRKLIIFLPCWLAGLRAGPVLNRYRSVLTDSEIYRILFWFNEQWDGKSRRSCFLRENEECIDSLRNWICWIHKIDNFRAFSTAARSCESSPCNGWKNFDVTLLICRIGEF